MSANTNSISANQALEEANFARAYSLRNKITDVPWRFPDAIKHGSWKTKLSLLIMGFGNIIHGQIVKGLLWLSVEVLFIWYMIARGFADLGGLVLGGEESVQTLDPTGNFYIYTEGDNSVHMLLWGIVAIAVIVGFIYVWKSSVESAYKAEYITKEGFRPANLKEDIVSLFNNRIHNLLLTLPLGGIIIFTILPLIFMMAMAFTGYSRKGGALTIFNWVGFDNFTRVLSTGNSIGRTFWPIVAWTLLWAILATVLNFVFGVALAMVINRKRTKFKSFWRVMFTTTIAVPQFISLLVVRQMLADNGAMNLMITNIAQNLNFIGANQSITLPFWSNATWARVTVVIVNLWVGVPYTLLQVTGILQNFPSEQWEAGDIDGANAWQQFRHITLPYILNIMGPFMITQFTGNVNNFNVIYLLTGGGPARAGTTAGHTDLLVTWLYKLTIDQQYYNIGSVVGIFTFIVLSVIALTLYRFTSSAKD